MYTQPKPHEDYNAGFLVGTAGWLDGIGMILHGVLKHEGNYKDCSNDLCKGNLKEANRLFEVGTHI